MGSTDERALAHAWMLRSRGAALPPLDRRTLGELYAVRAALQALALPAAAQDALDRLARLDGEPDALEHGHAAVALVELVDPQTDLVAAAGGGSAHSRNRRNRVRK